MKLFNHTRDKILVDEMYGVCEGYVVVIRDGTELVVLSEEMEEFCSVGQPERKGTCIATTLLRRGREGGGRESEGREEGERRKRGGRDRMHGKGRGGEVERE